MRIVVPKFAIYKIKQINRILKNISEIERRNEYDTENMIENNLNAEYP